MILSETASPRSGWTQALVKEWLKVVSDSLVSLIRTPPKFLYVALALSLALPALLASFTMVFENAEKNLLKNLNVTVFLNTEASQNDARALAANMAGNSQIKTTSVSTVTVHGKEIFTISMVPATDLTIEDLTPIVEGLNRHTLIDYVDSDRIWVEDSIAAVDTARTLHLMCLIVTALFTAMMGFAIARFDIARLRSERVILSQLGASRASQMKPAIYRALILSVLVVIAATTLAWALLSIVPSLVDISSIEPIFPTRIPLASMIMLTAVAATSGAISAMLLGKFQKN